ncbi:MAG: ABC transporter ATP-binding protein [Lachnospiraceae bacterium]|nr:ABC transporter ATP-binding protein [Lachnospiraceae bacterium]
MSALKEETAYNTAYSYADELHESIGDFLFLQEKGQKVNVKFELKDCAAKLRRTKNRFLTKGNISDLKLEEGAKLPAGSIDSCIDKFVDELRSARTVYRLAGKDKSSAIDTVRDILERVRELVGGLVERETPDFLSIGYYEYKHSAQDIESLDTAAINKKTSACLRDEFLNEFTEYVDQAIRYSHEQSIGKKKEILAELDSAKTYYEGAYTKSAAKSYAKKLASGVENSIDELEIVKDSYAYTFRSSLLHAIEQYFYFTKHNPKEEARFARQSKKREALIARGKKVDWKVVPKRVRDLAELREEVSKVVATQDERYRDYIENDTNGNTAARATEMIEWFRHQASQAVYKINKRIAKEKAIRLMKEVGISEPRIRYNQYPFEFSGGMRQRIVIAIALAADPDILICDEPTTALDVTIQAQILELINKLKAERNLSVVFITHDLGVVANMADDIAVMYAGKIVEYGTADDVFYDPRHPYTWALLSSMPDLDTKEKLDAIPGTPPNMIYPPEGDAFAARNKYAMQIDYEEQPPQFAVSDTHWAATWLLHPDAPKVEIPKTISDRIERMRKKNEAAEAEA